MRDHYKIGHYVDELIRTYVSPWSSHIYLERLLEGEALPSVSKATAYDAVRAVESFELSSCNILSDEDIFENCTGANIANRNYVLQPGPDGTPACISASLDGGTTRFPFGARHIFEGSAQLRENPMTGTDWDEMRQNSSSHHYWAAWVMTMYAYGLERVKNKDNFDEVYNTFLVLCDLALFVPIGAVSQLEPYMVDSDQQRLLG